MRAFPRVELVVDAATLERTAVGAIAGRIWLRDGDAEVQGDFPEVGWSDTPVALLARWLPALQRLARAVPATGDEVRCTFGEGPYAFVVAATGFGRWRLRCYERRAGAAAERPSQEWVTEASHFLASATGAARAVLAYCDARGWWSEDTETLRRALQPGPDARER